VTEVGTGRSALDTGLMLTRDQAVVDIEFQVVWNIDDPSAFLFNLADPTNTVRAVAESAMRDIIARRELSPILNQDRASIASDLRIAVQSLLDSYRSGINVIRINFDRADPPREVIDSFREVQAARQERDRLERQADAYANRVLAGARGEAAQILEQAEAYRAEVVNAAQGEASRFIAVWEEYRNAPDVTRQRMYLETMERVLGAMDLTILDNVTGPGGQGVVPYLPLSSKIRAVGVVGGWSPPCRSTACVATPARGAPDEPSHIADPRSVRRRSAGPVVGFRGRRAGKRAGPPVRPGAAGADRAGPLFPHPADPGGRAL